MELAEVVSVSLAVPRHLEGSALESVALAVRAGARVTVVLDKAVVLMA